ncbi:hypothetical protein ADK49_12790 [Streptomyces sp. WM6349]|uniref:Uncharacterized protein n=1 Tax=Streptomyces antibioticus TaxID=1890 RepID=A0ABX3LPR7_STRAT|nr:hypothetical protein ADK49_12790 [Streptomyces sp. WM6349]OOQ54016.1 hypothetical protein AFM16_05290 [Streptomyces antibioticus]
MAGRRVHHSARRWAGLLVLLALMWCTTGLGRAAMTADHAMPAMETAAAQGPEVPARAHDRAVAAPMCPMDAMECARPFQD